MKSIQLEWEKTSYAKIKELGNARFYMFSRIGKIIYIGQLLGSNAQNELRNKKISVLNNNVSGVTIWLGYIKDDKKLKKNVSRDIMNLLISKTKPSENSKNNGDYRGKKMCVINNGCSLLYETIYSHQPKENKFIECIKTILSKFSIGWYWKAFFIVLVMAIILWGIAIYSSIHWEFYISKDSTVITVIGIIAGLIVIGNYAQVNEIRNTLNEKIKEVERRQDALDFEVKKERTNDSQKIPTDSDDIAEVTNKIGKVKKNSKQRK